MFPPRAYPSCPPTRSATWIAAKQPKIWDLPEAADQVGLVAVGVPSFAVEVMRVSPAALVGAGASAGPDLVTDPNGPAWLVTQSASAGVSRPVLASAPRSDHLQPLRASRRFACTRAVGFDSKNGVSRTVVLCQMGSLRSVRSVLPLPAPDSGCLDTFEQELDYLFGTLQRLGARPGDMDDLLQDIFLILYRNWPTLDTTRALRPWLFGVAFRVVRTPPSAAGA